MSISDFMEQHGTTVCFQKKDYIFKQGDRDENLYLIKSGLLKAFYISQEGKEMIKSFFMPGEVIGSLTSAYKHEQCSFSLFCLEQCSLIKLPFHVMHNFTKESHDFSQEVIELLIAFAMKKERREYELLTLTAEERYIQLVEQSPCALLEKITQNDMALYLGITPVGLSRIKTRVNTRTN